LLLNQYFTGRIAVFFLLFFPSTRSLAHTAGRSRGPVNGAFANRDLMQMNDDAMARTFSKVPPFFAFVCGPA
jgi:hypothetical protein